MVFKDWKLTAKSRGDGIVPDWHATAEMSTRHAISFLPFHIAEVFSEGREFVLAGANPILGF